MSVLRIASFVAFSLSTAAFAADQSVPVTSAPQPTAAAPAPPAKVDKVVCRRTPEIGSLIKVKKECATMSEWRRRDLGARDTTRDIQTVGGSSTNQ